MFVNTNSINKQKYFCLLILLVLTIILSNVIFSKKEKVILDEVNLINNNTKNNMFSMYLEELQEDGTYTYVESKDTTWPTSYTFNKTKSGCVDNSGKAIDGGLEYDNGKVTLKTKSATLCYLYFDMDKTIPQAFTFNIGGSTNPEYTNTLKNSIYLKWEDTDITDYCIKDTEEKPSKEDGCWVKTNGVTEITDGVTTLTDTQGEQTKYAFLKDNFNNISEVVLDKITLDTQPPEVGATQKENYIDQVVITVNATDNSGIKSVTCDVSEISGASCSCAIDNTSCTFTGLQSDHSYENALKITVIDNADNSKEASGTYNTLKTVGDGYVIYHDGKGIYGDNEAGDNSYRFSGNNPNNYVCLDGNDNATGECNDITKLYRVIGWFPEENDPSKYRMKIIKSEYITASELGGNLSTSKVSKTSSSDFTSRVENSTDVDGFYWSGESSITWNNWVSSTLNQTLNSESGNYLKSLSAYTSLIENTKWYIGGNTSDSIYKKNNMKTAYDNELGANKLTTSSSQCTDNSTSKVPCTDALLYQTSKVGLMYATEYGYASAPKNWGTQLYSYDKKANRSENWLYNGVYEWTLSRQADITGTALDVEYSGYVYRILVNYSGFGVRPVLVLKSEATIKSGDGSKESPWRIKLGS